MTLSQVIVVFRHFNNMLWFADGFEICVFKRRTKLFTICTTRVWGTFVIIKYLLGILLLGVVSDGVRFSISSFRGGGGRISL